MSSNPQGQGGKEGRNSGIRAKIFHALAAGRFGSAEFIPHIPHWPAMAIILSLVSWADMRYQPGAHEEILRSNKLRLSYWPGRRKYWRWHAMQKTDIPQQPLIFLTREGLEDELAE